MGYILEEYHVGCQRAHIQVWGLPLTCHMPMGKPLNLSGLQRDERFSGEALLSPPASRLMSKWEFSGPATYHTDILDLSTVPHPKPWPQPSGRWEHPAANLPPALQRELQADGVCDCGKGEADESLLPGCLRWWPKEHLFICLWRRYLGKAEGR